MTADTPSDEGIYSDKEPPESVIHAAASMTGAASRMAASSSGDVKIYDELVHVRYLRPEQAKRILEAANESSAHADEVIEVAWSYWVHPGRFTLDLLNDLNGYIECATMRADVLLSGDAISYGLGPEDAFLASDEHCIEGIAFNTPPDAVLDELAQHMRLEWSDELFEWTDGDPSTVASWPTVLREVAEDILAEHSAKDVQPAPKCPECGAPIHKNLMHSYCSIRSCAWKGPR